MSSFLSSRQASVLRERARAPTEAELAQIPWLPSLGPVERERALEGLVVTEVPAGDYIIRFGRSATYWFGLVDGLLKM